jgi:hypothetical protein
MSGHFTTFTSFHFTSGRTLRFWVIDQLVDQLSFLSFCQPNHKLRRCQFSDEVIGHDGYYYVSGSRRNDDGYFATVH